MDEKDYSEEYNPGISLGDDLNEILRKLRYIGIDQLNLQSIDKNKSFETLCGELLAKTYEAFLWTVKIQNELVKLGKSG